MEKESIVAPVQIVLDASAAARQLVSAEIQCHPGYADLHNRMGLIHVWDGRPELAADAFGEALAINPGYFWAAANRAFALLGAGRANEALAEYEESSTFSSAAEFALVRAALLVEGGRASDALEVLEMDASENPAYHYHVRALACLQLADRKGARSAILRAAEACPPLERLYRQRDLLGPGQLEGVSPRDAAAPIRVYPGLYELHDFFAEIYARHGFRTRSLQSYEESQLVWPDRGRHAWNMGRLASWMGDGEEAKERFSEAIEHAPDSVDPYIALGQEHAASGEVMAAISHLERAMELRPGYADVRYQLGLAYMEAGRHDDAVKAFRAAVSINPSFQFARLNLALALRRSGDRRGAVKEYEQLLASGRASADLYMNLGLAYLEDEDFVRAEDLFRSGVEADPEFALNHYYLGVTCQRQGRRQHARAAWKQFLERHRESELAREVIRELDE